MAKFIKSLSKSDPVLKYSGGWVGLPGGVVEELSSPFVFSQNSGSFASITELLCNEEGVDGVALQNGIHFEYDKRLDASVTEDPVEGYGSDSGGIYDINTEGAFGTNRCLRIIESSKNLKNSTGLNLKILAKNLSSLHTPPEGYAYIDPEQNKFVLPGPCFFKKTSSIPLINTIAESTGSLSPGNSFYPLGATNTLDKGTLSVWYYSNAAYTEGATYGSYAQCYIGATTVFTIWAYSYNYGSYGAYISYNGESWMALSTGYNHFHVCWDFIDKCPDGKMINIFTNGVSSWSGDITREVGPITLYGVTSGNTQSYPVCTDTYPLKIWNHELSTASAGMRLVTNALHPSYGVGNNYQPNNVEVGYIYLADSEDPAKIPAPVSNTAIEREDPSNYSAGAGMFGSIRGRMRDSSYLPLVSGVDFNYGKSLNGEGLTPDIWDDNASGPLSSGKYMRIVHRGRNIVDGAGLGLTPIAKDLTIEITPPPTQVYVDPIRNKFIFPRPLFWSKCESPTAFLTPEIKYGTPLIENWGTPIESWQIGPYGSGFGYWDGIGGKFGNCIRGYRSFVTNYGGTVSESGGKVLYPNGSNRLDWSKGVMSFWPLLAAGSHWVSGAVDTGGAVTLTLGMYPYLYIQLAVYHVAQSGGYVTNYCGLGINSSIVSSVGNIIGGFHNLYVLWDSSKSLSSGKSVRVFRNGTEILSSTVTLPSEISNYMFRVHFDYYGWGLFYATYHQQYPGVAYAYLDNLKIWDHIVSEDPSFEYNGGTGREDALHTIYGDASGYKPNLTSSDAGGVGYYRVGGAGTFLEWEI